MGNGPGAEGELGEPLAVLQARRSRFLSGDDGALGEVTMLGSVDLSLFLLTLGDACSQVGVFDLKNGTRSGPVRAGSVCLGGGVDVGCVPHTKQCDRTRGPFCAQGMLP